jgi:hypothetical protein
VLAGVFLELKFLIKQRWFDNDCSGEVVFCPSSISKA